jgi:hypothetical protein
LVLGVWNSLVFQTCKRLGSNGRRAAGDANRELMIVVFVTKRLAFGSKVRLYRHVAKLRELGITHVIDVRMYPSKKLRAFKTIHLNFKDNGRPRPMWFYARALHFYRKALELPNAKVYVMCRAGRRRSASLTYFLLRASGTSPSVAERAVLRSRPCATIVKGYRESGERYLHLRGICIKLGQGFLIQDIG